MRSVPFLLALTAASIPTNMNASDPRPSLILENARARLVTDLGGGSIASFTLTDSDLNPLNWDSWSLGPTPELPPTPDPRGMGHFLCLDRWGPATPAEEAHGMGPHGEASVVWWHVDPPPAGEADRTTARLSATLPMAGLRVDRDVALIGDQSCFVVTETIINTRPLGRVYNCVQHPSIAAPFLGPSTIVDCNGTRGFMQATPLPNPEDPEVRWPAALSPSGTEVDMRHLDPSAVPWVVSYIIEEPVGWITAANPDKGLLLGYLWSTKDYPWVSHWAHLENGKILYRGLEFGTTGLHQPEPALVEKGRIFDRRLIRYIDADESQAFRYAGFLLEIPADYAGTGILVFEDGVVRIEERGGRNRILTLKIGRIF
ncbi:MAG: hypothetical protein R3F07_03845 [Opitutaceae bacterium]